MAALLGVAVPEISVEGPKRMNFASLFHDLDLAGCLLFSPTMVMFLLALEWGGSTYPWNSAMIAGLLCGAAGNLAFFFIWEHKKGDSAMIPFQMVKQRVVYSAGLNIFFLYANSVITSYYLPIYFQGVRGKTPTLSGVYMLPSILGQMVFGIIAGLTGMLDFPSFQKCSGTLGRFSGSISHPVTWVDPRVRTLSGECLLNAGKYGRNHPATSST